MKRRNITPKIQRALITTGIATIGSMLVVSWQHRCIRATLDHYYRLQAKRTATVTDKISE